MARVTCRDLARTAISFGCQARHGIVALEGLMLSPVDWCEFNSL